MSEKRQSSPSASPRKEPKTKDGSLKDQEIGEALEEAFQGQEDIIQLENTRMKTMESLTKRDGDPALDNSLVPENLLQDQVISPPKTKGALSLPFQFVDVDMQAMSSPPPALMSFPVSNEFICDYCNLGFLHIRDYNSHRGDAHNLRTRRSEPTSSATSLSAQNIGQIYIIEREQITEDAGAVAGKIHPLFSFSSEEMVEGVDTDFESKPFPNAPSNATLTNQGINSKSANPAVNIVAHDEEDDFPKVRQEDLDFQFGLITPSADECSWPSDDLSDSVMHDVKQNYCREEVQGSSVASAEDPSTKGDVNSRTGSRGHSSLLSQNDYATSREILHPTHSSTKIDPDNEQHRVRMAPHKKESCQKKRKLSNDLKCQFCGRQSSSAYNLSTHLMIHMGTKPWACPVCLLKYRSRAELKTHLVIHTGEKPYKCPECNFRSNYKKSLVRHSLLHKNIEKDSSTPAE